MTMFPFKKTYDTPKEHSAGTNTGEFIILHHTATGEGTIQGVLDGLYKRADYASCHFVVDTNGDCYKIGDPKDILWHAGESEWTDTLTKKYYKDLNKYSVGIEIIGPLPGFTDAQRVSVRKLVCHLMAALKIPKEHVLRHKDIAPKRKVDIDDSFFLPQSYSYFTSTLYPEQYNQSIDSGIWGGSNPLVACTRNELSTMMARASKKDIKTIFSGDRPNDYPTKDEINIMSERAFGIKPINLLTRIEASNFCNNYRI